MRSPLSLVLTALLLVISACTQRVETIPTGTVGPTLVVEQFLSAANAKDLTRMSTLFGTKNGPVSKSWEKQELEQRMFIFANVLKHEDYKIEGEQIVPGRLNEATQLNVSLMNKDQKVTVPFVLVRTKDQKWLIEEFDMRKILNPTR
jgi:hypothetical protein